MEVRIDEVPAAYPCWGKGKTPSWWDSCGLVYSSGSEVKASTWNAGNPGSILGLGTSPGEGNGNSLQYFCLENDKDRGAWQATVHGVAEEMDTT